MSGLAEPLGVVIAAYLLPALATPTLVESLLAAVAGIMAFLALHELLPLAIEHSGRKEAVTALFVGVSGMALLLWAMGDIGGT